MNTSSMRLDCFIAKKFHGISRQRAIELIKNKQVTVNDKIICKPSVLVAEHDIVILGQDYFIDSEICYSRAAIKLQRFLQNTSVRENSFLYIKDDYVPISKIASCMGILQSCFTHYSIPKEPSIIHLEIMKQALYEVIKDSVILDVGASTGGFTQVLLSCGAKCVVAQDVGTLQLDVRLRQNKQIISIERVDVRDFAHNYRIYEKQIRNHLNSLGCNEQVNASLPFCFLTCDVSFISLKNILPSLLQLSDCMLLLFKPQYEVGVNIKRNKKGVIQDSYAITNSLQSFLKYLETLGAQLIFIEKSFLSGKEGNEEFFIFCQFKAPL